VRAASKAWLENGRGVTDPGYTFAYNRRMAKHKHLSRLDSVWADNPVFFITVCAVDRRAELANDRLHGICREVWSNCETRYGWRVGRYVLMPDHAHFFSWQAVGAGSGSGNVCGSDAEGGFARAGLTEASYNLSTFIGKWKEWTAKYSHRRYGIEVPLWQAEFFDHVMRSWESYEEKWTYVRENPTRAGLVDSADDWPYQGEIHKLTEL